MNIHMHTLLTESVTRLNDDVTRDCVVNTTFVRCNYNVVIALFVLCIYNVYIVNIIDHICMMVYRVYVCLWSQFHLDQ